MPIQVQVREVSLSQRESGEAVIVLNLVTTNTAHPGKELRFSQAYKVTLSAGEIKAQIDAAVRLLWVAMGLPEWTV